MNHLPSPTVVVLLPIPSLPRHPPALVPDVFPLLLLLLLLPVLLYPLLFSPLPSPPLPSAIRTRVRPTTTSCSLLTAPKEPPVPPLHRLHDLPHHRRD